MRIVKIFIYLNTIIIRLIFYVNQATWKCAKIANKRDRSIILLNANDISSFRHSLDKRYLVGFIYDDLNVRNSIEGCTKVMELSL